MESFMAHSQHHIMLMLEDVYSYFYTPITLTRTLDDNIQ